MQGWASRALSFLVPFVPGFSFFKQMYWGSWRRSRTLITATSASQRSQQLNRYLIHRYRSRQVVDMPLLFETKMYKLMHPNILVTCNDEQQVYLGD